MISLSVSTGPLGRARHLLGDVLLRLAAGAARYPGLDDQVRRVRRDGRQDLVGEARERRAHLRGGARLVQLAERDHAARDRAAASRSPRAATRALTARGAAAAGIGAAGRASTAAAAIRPSGFSPPPSVMKRVPARAADAHQVAAACGAPQRRRRLLGGRDALPIDLQDDVALAHAGRRRRAARRDLRDDRAARPALDAHRLRPAPASASAAPARASAPARPRAPSADGSSPSSTATFCGLPSRTRPTVTREPIARVDT